MRDSSIESEAYPAETVAATSIAASGPRRVRAHDPTVPTTGTGEMTSIVARGMGDSSLRRRMETADHEGNQREQDDASDQCACCEDTEHERPQPEMDE